MTTSLLKPQNAELRCVIVAVGMPNPCLRRQSTPRVVCDSELHCCYSIHGHPSADARQSSVFAKEKVTAPVRTTVWIISSLANGRRSETCGGGWRLGRVLWREDRAWMQLGPDMQIRRRLHSGVSVFLLSSTFAPVHVHVARSATPLFSEIETNKTCVHDECCIWLQIVFDSPWIIVSIVVFLKVRSF